jgi:hypothetical protein
MQGSWSTDRLRSSIGVVLYRPAANLVLCVKAMIGIGQNECLRKVAAQASANEAWSDYAHYCRNREAGLRGLAFQHLEKFLRNAKSWSFDDRSVFVNWLCLRIAEFGESDSCGLIPQPLTEQLVVPTLLEWAVAHFRSAKKGPLTLCCKVSVLVVQLGGGGRH